MFAAKTIAAHLTVKYYLLAAINILDFTWQKASLSRVKLSSLNTIWFPTQSAFDSSYFTRFAHEKGTIFGQSLEQ